MLLTGTRERNKKICSNCYGKNYLDICICGCNELIFKIDKWGQLIKYKKGHYWRNKKGNKNPNFKCRTRITKIGYCIFYYPNHPKAPKYGYMPLHRHVYEYFHKCCLLPNWDIHHINCIKSDNHKHNLIPVLKKDHIIIDKINQKRIRINKINRFCLLCNGKTISNNKNCEMWYKYKNGYICHSCHYKERWKKLKDF